MALKVQLLVPELQCFRGYSQVHCMQAIKNGYVETLTILLFILYVNDYCQNIKTKLSAVLIVFK